jgi:hypothetical protein
MSPRHTWIWILLAGGLLAFIFLYELPRRQDVVNPKRVLSHFNTEEITNIEVLPKGLELGIRAERTRSGWRLTSPVTYPAQSTNIENLLLTLNQLEPAAVLDEKQPSGNATRPGELYGFTEPQATLIFNTGDLRLRIGRRTAPGDQCYLQIVGKEGIYVVDAGLLNFIPSSTNNWRDTALLDIRGGVPDRIIVTNGTKILEMQKDPATALWRIIALSVSSSSYRADSPKVEAALRHLGDSRIGEFVTDDPKADLDIYGLQPPNLVLGLAQGSNSIATLQFGKTNGIGQVFAKRAGQPAVFTVSEELAEAWRVSPNSLRSPYLVSLPRLPTSIAVQADDQFSLEQQASNSWRIVPQNYPADAMLVQDLLTNLSAMPIADFTKDVAAELLLPDYGLAPPSRRYTLQWPASSANAGPSNAPSVQLLFGATNVNKVYARRSDEPAVYAVNLTDLQRLPAASWQLRERRAIDVDIEDVVGITAADSGQARQLIRKQAYEWTLGRQTLGMVDSTQMLAIETTARGLAHVPVTAWAGHGAGDWTRFGFKETGQRVVIELRGGGQVTLDFGGESPSGAPYAAVSLGGEPWLFEMPPLLYRDVVQYLLATPFH